MGTGCFCEHLEFDSMGKSSLSPFSELAHRFELSQRPASSTGRGLA